MEDKVTARRRVIGGDITSDLDTPDVESREDADRYLEESVGRYRFELARSRGEPDNPKIQHSVSMFLGRAIASVDMMHRLGFLDRDSFAKWSFEATGKFPPAQLGETRVLQNAAQALEFAQAGLQRTRLKRTRIEEAKLTSPPATQKLLFNAYLLHLGSILEVLAVLLKQRFISATTYDDLTDEVYTTLLPSTVDIPKS